ncbi:hypothetical protein ABPG72_016087 [Tetrahymena utriculariae]
MSQDQIKRKEINLDLQNSSQIGESNREESKENQRQWVLKKQKKTIRKYEKRSYKLQAQFKILDSVSFLINLTENYFFNIDGDLFINIKNSFTPQNCTQKNVKQVFIYDKYVQADLCHSQSLKNFELPIKILESSQDLKKYKFAQQLRIHQDYSQMRNEAIKQIKDAYQNKEDELSNLCDLRSQYRKGIINKCIKEELVDQEFFQIIELSTNFQFYQTDIKSMYISKGTFALIGLEENNLSQFLLRIGFLDSIFTSQSEVYFGAILEIIQNELLDQFIFKQDFTLISLDDLKIFYDAYIKIKKVNYPPELFYSYEQQIQHELDFILIIKFDLEFNSIKSILNHRKNNNQFLQTENILCQSFEYSLLSQVFLEKFYPDIKTEMVKESEINKKTCKFKFI